MHAALSSPEVTVPFEATSAGDVVSVWTVDVVVLGGKVVVVVGGATVRGFECALAGVASPRTPMIGS
jgi:hypothetical protein